MTSRVGSEGPVALQIIGRKKLFDADKVHGDLRGSLDSWCRIADTADWKSLEEVRNQFPKTDRVGEYTVFNIKGNAYRLISKINYRTKTLFILHVLTHAEYDKERWKK